MKRIFLLSSLFITLFFISRTAEACHGLALVNYSAVVGPNGITINGSSDPNTNGCNNHYMEIQIGCGGSFSVSDSVYPGCNGSGWNLQYWWRSNPINKPTASLVPFSQVFIPFTSLCPGTTYVLRSREKICVANANVANGPWSNVLTFTTPGTPPPLVIDSVTAVNQFLCIGDSTQVNVFTTGGCTSGRIYSWSPTTGVSNPAIANPFITPTQTTTYTVTTLDPCSNVTDTDTITIFVSTPPSSGTILPTLSTNDMILCEGDTMNITIFGSGSTTFQWQSSTNGITFNSISGATDSTVLIGPLTQSTQFRVLISSSLGCPAFSSIGTVTVIPAPIITITNDTALCLGQAIQLFASGGTTYNWTPNNGTLSSQTSSTPICNTNVSQKYYVTVTNQFGCSAQDSVTITINGLPTVSGIGLLADCGKDNGRVRVTNIGGNGVSPYIFSLNGIAFQSDSIFTNLPIGGYVITIEDANGCQAQSSPIGVSEQIITNASFTANGQQEITEGLDPFDVTVLNNSSNATNFIWDFGNGQTGSSPGIGDTTKITYTLIGEYEIVLIAYDSIPRCSDTTRIKVVVDGLSSLEMPNVFTPNGDGKNDIFGPKQFDIISKTGTRNIVEYKLQVFDRWGKLVFESNDVNFGWDGKRKGGAQASDGVYYWTVSATGIDNQSYTPKGNVTLLR